MLDCVNKRVVRYVFRTIKMTMYNYFLIPISVTSVTPKGCEIRPSELLAVSSRTPRFVTVDRGDARDG